MLLVLVPGSVTVIISDFAFIQMQELFGHPILNFSRAGQNKVQIGATRLCQDTRLCIIYVVMKIIYYVYA